MLRFFLFVIRLQQIRKTLTKIRQNIFLLNQVPKFFKQLIFPRELNLLFLSIFLFAITLGMNAVSFPAILNKNGVDAARIGIAFTLDCLGGILISFFLSLIVSRLKMMKTMAFAAIAYSVIILTIYFYQNFYLWMLLAFTMGGLWFMYVITRQSWLNILLTEKTRGVGLGVFSMLISAGIALGPVVVKFVGAENYLSFVIAALLTLISFLCLLPLADNQQPVLEPRRIALKEFFQTNPRIFLARFFLDLQTYVLITFTVIFGVKIGLSYEVAGLLISAYMASGFCDLAIGFLLKKWNPYQLINYGFLGSMCSFLLIIFFHNYKFLLCCYFLFGVFVACIYVSSFKVCNDDFRAQKLVAANATFQLIGALGSLSGSLIGGVLFNVFGAIGFPITIVLSCACCLWFFAIYQKRSLKNNASF